MTNFPSTDSEWTIHSINIHGVFFERWCQQAIESVNGWKVEATQYPVDFISQNGRVRGNESALDIRAELNHESLHITLLIECKKNNPDFVNWIFFPTVDYLKRKSSSVFLPLLQYSSPKSGTNSSEEYWKVHRAISNFGLVYSNI
jgi:hypothetical protein